MLTFCFRSSILGVNVQDLSGQQICLHKLCQVYKRLEEKNASGCWLLWKLCRIKWTQENFCLYIFHHIFDGISISVLYLFFYDCFEINFVVRRSICDFGTKNPVTFVDVIFHHKPKQMARNPFPLDWCKLTGAYISEQVKSKLLTEFEALTPPPLNGRHRDVKEIYFSFWVISLSVGTFAPWVYPNVKPRICLFNDECARLKWPLVSFCYVSVRLKVNGQNRAVWWKASDRKCHFHLSAAAAKPLLAHCPARHFTFSSPAIGMDLKTVNFRQSFGLTISDLFPFFSLLISHLFCQNQWLSQTLFSFCLLKFSDYVPFFKTWTQSWFQTKVGTPKPM